MTRLPRLGLILVALSSLATRPGLAREEEGAGERARRIETDPRADSAPAPGSFPVKLAARPGLENLIQASERVFSGGEPATEAALAELARMGIKTIVSVDGARPNLDAARRHGIRYVHVPVGYGGIGEKALGSLTRVAGDIQGPIYVHCHHGKHRGPAAAAIICRADRGIAGTEARKLLELAGTSESYRGLWRDVEAYRKPEPGASLPPLAEVADVRSLAGAMARIDRSHDNLELSAEAKWGVPEGHPDIAPPREALILEEGFRDSVRHADDRDNGRLKLLLGDVLRKVADFQDALEAGRLGDATKHWNSIKETCEPCHKTYRN